MFFFIIGIGLGVYLAQEYEHNIPKMRVLVIKASEILRDAIRGDENDSDKDA